jgi:hypothetical protein
MVLQITSNSVKKIRNELMSAYFENNSIVIPFVKYGDSIVADVVLRYYGGVDFEIVSYGDITVDDSIVGSKLVDNVLTVNVFDYSGTTYSNLDFKITSGLNLVITDFDSPLPTFNNSYENRASDVRVDTGVLRAPISTKIKEEYGTISTSAMTTFLDIDLDGDDDIFLSVHWYGEKGKHSLENMQPVPGELYINDGKGNFTLDKGLIIPDMPRFVHPRDFINADLNGDGYSDIIMADHGWDYSPYAGEPLKVLISNPDGTYRVETIAERRFYHGITAFDADGDGDIDIVTNIGNLLLNDGKGNFVEDQIDIGRQIYGVVSSDLNKDGRVDFISMGHSSQNTPKLWINTNDGFESKELLFKEDYNTILDASILDLDLDGILDIVFLATGSYQTDFWYKGVGIYANLFNEDSSVKELVEIFDDQYIRWFDYMNLLDIDSDGDLDIVSEDARHDFTLINNSDMSFGF